MDLCAERTRRIARGTLTFEADDFEAAYGRVRDFWARVRKRWLGTRYFCWLELTARGRAHYHWVWLNPPNRREINLQAWVDRAWTGARTQVRFVDARGALAQELGYVLEYSKKMGRKSYQQRYDEVPSQLRTFMSQRLEIPPEEVDKHLDRDLWQYTPQTSYRGELVEESIKLVGQVVHLVPIGGRCSANDHRRPRPGNSMHLRR
jgi:hypothetical protein